PSQRLHLVIQMFHGQDDIIMRRIARRLGRWRSLVGKYRWERQHPERRQRRKRRGNRCATPALVLPLARYGKMGVGGASYTGGSASAGRRQAGGRNDARQVALRL